LHYVVARYDVQNLFNGGQRMAKWNTPKQVAEYLGLSESKVNHDIMDEKGIGKLFYRIGKNRRADLDEVDAFVKGGSK
tara:strand:+ start:186 stop:419 length:234 start_codon:yes stop_codon:yes gene_type:complete